MAKMATSVNFDLYWGLGLEYYVSARATFLAGRVPVAGNLFHHSIEYLLKAQLSQTRAEVDLEARRHNLRALWKDFKAEFPSSNLTQFDKLIKEIHRFEELRYPRKGMDVRAEWERPQVATVIPIPKIPRAGSKIFRPPSALREYPLYVHDIDHLVVEIFRLSARPLKANLGVLNPYARTAIASNNPFVQHFL